MIEKKIKKRLQAKLEKSEIFIQDMTGNNNHFNVIIISDSFSDLTLIQQHKMVYALLDDMITKEIHALQLKTLTDTDFISNKKP